MVSRAEPWLAEFVDELNCVPDPFCTILSEIFLHRFGLIINDLGVEDCAGSLLCAICHLTAEALARPSRFGQAKSLRLLWFRYLSCRFCAGEVATLGAVEVGAVFEDGVW